jgi:uncharacterized integral membrane protein
MNEKAETRNWCRIYCLLMFRHFLAFSSKQHRRPIMYSIISKALIVTVTILITSNFTQYKVKYYKTQGKSNLNVFMVNHFEQEVEETDTNRINGSGLYRCRTPEVQVTSTTSTPAVCVKQRYGLFLIILRPGLYLILLCCSLHLL